MTSIAAFKILRSGYEDPVLHWVSASYAVLWYNFDSGLVVPPFSSAPGGAPGKGWGMTFLETWFVFSVLVPKVQEFCEKMHVVIIFNLPWSFGLASVPHLVVYPLALARTYASLLADCFPKRGRILTPGIFFFLN
jgi:hypothetical protein